MESPSKYSTIAAWAIAISRALSASGVDPYQVFDAAGLSLKDVEVSPESRIAIEHMTRLWHLADKATGSSAFGLTVGQYAYPMHFRSLGLLMMTSASLAQAFETLPNYSALVSNSAAITLQRTPDRLGFTIMPLPGVDISPMSIDAFFATLMHHGELILGHGKFVLTVELMRPEPKDKTPWHSSFSCPVSFNKPVNCLWMDRGMLEQATVMGNPKLAAQNETKVRQYLDTMQALQWQERTSQAIHAMLASGEPTAQKVAQVYNVSERTLSRKLNAEGSSFRLLLQQKRQELAYHYLMNTELSITLLSDRLGYSSLTNFSRAFHRWHGASPAAFREQSKI
ncbi:AraC family transcriptional regulator [Shewanella sp. UCD-KL12]|uniref:AraC family transcriptional regulator n=1 Tax=Shewanella sp. UCD-KL12 TaxID=1917163 RepID=UPI000970CFA6|nr:AraC family transcriptional regulator [Shewanella sp. UCD-KL12]